MNTTDTFVGRRTELVALRESLTASTLVTLVGPGGVGKSRLAHHLAGVSASLWPGGTVAVDLSETGREQEVVVAVAEAAGHPLSRHKPAEQLGLDLRDRAPTLLILDNADRCVAAIATLTHTWRRQAPDLTVLVTSRRPLAVAGERRITLEPLSEEDAVALFRARAQAMGATVPAGEDQVLRELVRRLDGLPLAIELAAGRAAAFTPTSLLDRLDQRFQLLRTRRRDVAERHTTLRRTIDWSWELLEPWEQHTLAQCAVFQGGFSMEAAEAVVELDDEDAWVPDAIQSLVDQALLRTSPAPGFPDELRFTLYMGVREYVRARADTSDLRSAATRRHEAWTLGHAERWAADAERSGLSSTGLRRLALERDNVLTVYRRAVASRPAVALRALLAVDILMHWTGATPVQLERLERVLGQATELPPELVERARVARSLAALWCGDIAKARAELEGVLARVRSTDTASSSPQILLVARALLVLSQASYYADDLDDALDAAQQALALGEATESLGIQATAHARLAMALSVREPKAAHGHYMASVRLERRQGSRFGAAFGATQLAQSATEPSLAIDTLGEWLTVVRDIGAAVGEGTLLGDLAESHARMGQLETASELAQQAIDASERARNQPALVRHLGRLGWIHQARGDAVAAREAYRRARRIATTEDMPVQAALLLGNEGSLLHEGGQLQAALRHYTQAEEAIADRDLPWLRGVLRLRRALALAESGDTAGSTAALEEARARLSGEEDQRALEIADAFLALTNPHTSSTELRALKMRADATRDAHERARQWAFRTDAAPLDEVGLAHRLLSAAHARRAEARPEEVARLRVAPDGSWFHFADAEADLTRRRAMRRILHALAVHRDTAPGDVIPLFDLVDAGWPGERTLPEAGANRVYSAVRDLRKLGLRSVLVRADDGYRLDPRVPFAWSDPD